ncbi:hypothetical protein MCUN1_002132 [Malassezia cuniculi]|uniref:SERRATE/Ars2 N-terminal domain-containing protein n=1 Tax=Malassezia cuniculi TaxID=948313 RepID=A0AAF0JBG8_9BASI|nr:hypothetical protein MCUN1_002132 [Malassezia cuniculi]
MHGHEKGRHDWGSIPMDPLDIDTRLSFKSYVALQRAVERENGSASPPHEERMRGYRAYRTAFQQRALWNFFLEHYDSEWFREKYDADAHFAALRAGRRRVGRAGRSEAWISQLESGELDHVNNDLHPGENLYTVVSRLGGLEHFDSDVLSIPPDTEHQLLVRSWPPELPRERLEEHLASYPGFRYVAMLEPIVQRRWVRSGIAVFADGTDMREAVSVLDGKAFGDFTLHLSILERPSTSRLRFAPEATNGIARLKFDAERAAQLITKFAQQDADVAGERIVDAISRRCAALAKDDERRTLKLRLDLLLDALRTVFHCDYYLGLVSDFPEELERRSARHVRRQSEHADSEEVIAQDSWWTEHLDRKIDLLLHPDTPTLVANGGIDVGADRSALVRPFIREDGGNYRCHVDVGGRPCAKLFSDLIFTEQHVVNKHAAVLGSSLTRIELAEYYHSYLSDPMRVSATATGTAAATAPSGVNEPRRAKAERDFRDGGGERSVSMPYIREGGSDTPLLRFGARSVSGGISGAPQPPPALIPPLAVYMMDAVAAKANEKRNGHSTGSASSGTRGRYRDLDGGAPQKEQDLQY